MASGRGDAEQPSIQLLGVSAPGSPRNLLLPRGVRAERPWARLRVRVYRAEGLPALRPGLLGSLTRALQEQRVLVDPYVRVTFLGQQVSAFRAHSVAAQADPAPTSLHLSSPPPAGRDFRAR